MAESLEYIATHFWAAIGFLFGLGIITHFLYKVIKEFLNFIGILIKGQPTINNYKDSFSTPYNNIITGKFDTTTELDDSKKK
jgi:hypothetical protein